MALSGGRTTTIRIALPDGSPRGLRIAGTANWSGVLLMTARSGYPIVRERPEFDRPGVYLLRGPGRTRHAAPRVYIGQADNARERLDQHAKRLSFWSDLALLTSKDGHLNRAHVQYVEARLIALANDAGSADLENGNAPRPPYLSDLDRPDADEFLREALVFFPLLGFDYFEADDPPSLAPPISRTAPRPAPPATETPPEETSSDRPIGLPLTLMRGARPPTAA